jgi:hypothetical protein
MMGASNGKGVPVARRAAFCSAAVAVLALVFAETAPADSLVFIKGYNVWIANADGSNARRVTRDGTARFPYESPSEADDGTIVAVRATAMTRRRIYRMRQDGQLLNRPVDTPAPGTGAINAKVSPNGRLVAYWFVTNVPSPGCPFCVNAASQALISNSNRFTPPFAVGTPRTGGWPSWIGNDTLVLTSGSAELWYYRLGMREARKWFADFETGGGTPIPTLLDAEISPNRTRLAVVRGDNQETVVLYKMNGRPPARPSSFTANCRWNAQTGRLADPTWSSDGRLLALQDGNDIHIVSLPSLSDCRRARVLRVIRGGSQPDYGRAPRRAASNQVGAAVSDEAGVDGGAAARRVAVEVAQRAERSEQPLAIVLVPPTRIDADRRYPRRIVARSELAVESSTRFADVGVGTRPRPPPAEAQGATDGAALHADL